MSPYGCFRPILLLTSVLISSAHGGPIANTSLGLVEGFTTAWKTSAFLGIPYAAPPVGSLRFRPPQPAKAWSGTLNATAVPLACASYPNRRFPHSEDCLYLNVFAPAQLPAKPLPVMVWIHGGCYTAGAAKQYRVEPISRNLVSHGIIVVSIQYRLGIFGFLTTRSPELPSNLGVRDMVAALEWVRREAGAFGGDPAKVTIAGESAGAGAVSLISYAPAARGLFAGAIQESGVAGSPVLLEGGLDAFHRVSRAAAVHSACLTTAQWDAGATRGLADCLRKLNTSQMVELGGYPMTQDVGAVTCWWVPVMDPSGDILPDWPRNLAKNRTKNMPFLIGTNHDEEYVDALKFIGGIQHANELSFRRTADFYILQHFQPVLREEIYKGVQKVYGFNSLVEATNRTTWFRAISQMVSDNIFFQSYDKELRLLNQTTANVFLYSFDYVSPNYNFTSTVNPTGIKGVFHAMDLYYLFNATHRWASGPTDQAMVATFGVLWANFVRTGDPNRPSSPFDEWRRSGDPSSPAFLRLLPEPRMATTPYQPRARWLYGELLPRLTGWRGPTLPPGHSTNASSPSPGLPTAQSLRSATEAALPVWAYAAAASLSAAVVFLLTGTALALCVFCRKRK